MGAFRKFHVVRRVRPGECLPSIGSLPDTHTRGTQPDGLQVCVCLRSAAVGTRRVVCFYVAASRADETFLGLRSLCFR